MDSAGGDRADPWYAREAAPLAAQLARLEALVDWERRDRAAGMRVSLEPARDLLARAGDPQRGRPLVLVAGTKGKGSTLAFVEAALEAVGVRTALFTSPHVESVTERLRIAGRAVEPERLAAGLERALAARDAAAAEGTPGADATWFDLVVVGSAVTADTPEVAVWLVEVGLGGRLDSTNALDPTVSAVTSIALEHTAVLGDTREQIAAEKAAIARPGRALVLGLDPGDPAAARAVQVAAAAGARVVPAAAAGGVDARNRAVAAAILAELEALGVGTGARGALAELAPPRLPGRLEVWPAAQGLPAVALDGAHVPESVELALAALAERPDLPGRPDAVFSCGRDKRVDELLKVLGGASETLLCCSLPRGGAVPAEELARRAERLGLAAEVEPDPVRALDRALSRAASRGGWVLATGSFHLLAPLRAHLRRRHEPC